MQMKAKYGVKENRPLADFLPTLTIAAKNLATEMTNYNVTEKDMYGEESITNEHIDNNLSVRSMLNKRGIKPENIFLTSNGRILELNEDGAALTGTVPFGKIMVDGLGVGDVGNIVLRDRQHLSQDGLIIVVMTMDSATGEIVAGPDVISRGFVYVRESENLMEDVKRMLRDEVHELEAEGIRDWSTIKSKLKDSLRDYIFVKTKRNPMILPIIMEI